MIRFLVFFFHLQNFSKIVLSRSLHFEEPKILQLSGQHFFSTLTPRSPNFGKNEIIQVRDCRFSSEKCPSHCRGTTYWKMNKRSIQFPPPQAEMLDPFLNPYTPLTITIIFLKMSSTIRTILFTISEFRGPQNSLEKILHPWFLAHNLQRTNFRKGAPHKNDKNQYLVGLR